MTVQSFLTYKLRWISSDENELKIYTTWNHWDTIIAYHFKLSCAFCSLCPTYRSFTYKFRLTYKIRLQTPLRMELASTLTFDLSLEEVVAHSLPPFTLMSKGCSLLFFSWMCFEHNRYFILNRKIWSAYPLFFYSKHICFMKGKGAFLHKMFSWMLTRLAYSESLLASLLFQLVPRSLEYQRRYTIHEVLLIGKQSFVYLPILREWVPRFACINCT